MQLNLARLAYPVTALGPGRRLVLWTAGCLLRCQNCITPELLSPTSGQAIAVDRLAQHLLRLPLALDGITLSGGEPFLQAPALAHLCQILRPARPHWTVLAFSGYPLAYLQQHPANSGLLAQVDGLVAGPYQPQQAQAHPLLASRNQQLHYLSLRGQTELKPAIAALPLQQANLGFHAQADHSPSAPAPLLIGILSPETRQHLHQQLHRAHTVWG